MDNYLMYGEIHTVLFDMVKRSESRAPAGDGAHPIGDQKIFRNLVA